MDRGHDRMRVVHKIHVIRCDTEAMASHMVDRLIELLEGNFDYENGLVTLEWRGADAIFKVYPDSEYLYKVKRDIPHDLCRLEMEKRENAFE